MRSFVSYRPRVIWLCVIFAIIFAAWQSADLVSASDTPNPTSVTIPANFQSELGCAEDWQPPCNLTYLNFDANDDVWQQTFNIPAGNWEYKAALNNSWDENYGANATRNGANIGLSLPGTTAVKFYYDHKTHWIADNKNKVIAVAPGSFQSELGCSGDWDPSCLRSWLQDPDGDGIYTFSTTALPAGNYETKVAINESWNENYGEGGVPGGPNISFNVPANNREVFFSYNPVSHILTVSAQGAPRGDLTKAKAYWVTRDTLAWNAANVNANSQLKLYYATEGGLTLTPDGVAGGVAIPLVYDSNGLPVTVKEKYPNLSNYLAFKIPSQYLAQVPEALKSQLAIAAATAEGTPIDATSLQIAGVLDDLYTFNGQLGIAFSGNAPTLRLWAPTARSVKLHLFDNSNPATAANILPMTGNAANGVWSITGNSDWRNKYYLFEVEVFVRSTGRVERNLVTDPYSVNLSINSQRSQIVNLSDTAVKPFAWDLTLPPAPSAPEDIVLYELHVRDFSVNDETVPTNERGTFKAFTRNNSNGMRHLSALARAGISHVHLLPAFDIASVNEDKSQWQQPAGDLSTLPPNSDQQQAAVNAAANQDGFNWGYDPWHFNAPEGSYATNPNGTTRILEFRQMVQSLALNRLNVVMDVVYNHTTASGQNDRSVFDRIVPGYYHRLNNEGFIERSTCCENTATENNMMEKFMIDSVVQWARQYKVNGFRFDLMGHHMKRNMVKLRQALDQLTIARDGIDGKRIYLYGEGWNFGEVANNARGVNAIQLNMPGTGIGTFNDRLRDAVRGGGPFSGLQEQGFINGLYYDPNAATSGSSDEQRARLLQHADWIKVSMAGNLAGFQLQNRFGNVVAGAQIDYNGQPAGYTADPQEIINYIDAHDNETIFDAIQMKAPGSASLADRIRMNNLGLGIVALGQGVPFFHAGSEILRSKSLDRNSYNSGDWFNKLDFTYNTNNFGVGLPPAGENGSNWEIMSQVLANQGLKPNKEQILDAFAQIREFIQIRKSTQLFRLRNAADINSNVRFFNNGPGQIPGVIVMSISDANGSIDRRRSQVVVVINADKQAHNFADSAFANQNLRLHPVLTNSDDPVVRNSTFNRATGTFSVPARTTAVFWSERSIIEQITLLINDIDRLRAANVLNNNQANELKARLNAALAAAQNSNNNAAIDQLRIFSLKVTALTVIRVLTFDQAQDLLFKANDIVNQL